jgi:hypothetical protein
MREVDREDRHSSKVIDCRSGIIRGAQAKKKEGIIDADTESDILRAVELCGTREFRPLLFVIPFAKVKKLIEKVPVPARAHPLSSECLIPLLPGRCFDVIELGAGTGTL